MGNKLGPLVAEISLIIGLFLVYSTPKLEWVVHIGVVRVLRVSSFAPE